MTAAIQPPILTPLRVWSALAALLVLAIIVFALLFQWNWLRAPLARYLSSRLGRPVTITGDLRVHPWSFDPWASVTGVTIGNPKWAGPGPMARLPRFTAQVELRPLLLHGKLIFPLVRADQPAVELLRDAAGRENWRASQTGKAAPWHFPAIRHLIISNGAVRYDDVRRRIRFSGTMSSSETLTGAGGGAFRLNGSGTIKSDPFTLVIRGGPLVRVDPNRPYAFALRLSARTTRVAADGEFVHPFDFGRLRGRLHVSGQNLGLLYPLVGVSLPDTPPYDLTTGFGRDDERFAFRGLRGRVGDSDLAGAISVNDETGRPFVAADLVSRRLKLADLEAVIGGGPRHTTGHTVSPAEKIMAVRLTSEHRLLPDARLDYARLRATDARLSYRAESVDAGKLPVRALSLKLTLDHGLLNIDPLAVKLIQGNLDGRVRLNGRRAPPVTSIDVALSNARLETIVERGAAHPPIAGGLYARAALIGAGDSVRAAAGAANGALTVVIPHGLMRQAFAELMGINVARGLIMILSKNKGTTPVRCAVADFKAVNGVLEAQSIVFDTGVVIATGAGQVNLRNETVNLTFAGKPKKFRLIRVGAPITIKGRLEKPKLGVDIAKAAPQLAVSVAIGAFLQPLAAILPFLGAGLAKDADCAALTAQARARGAPVRVGRR